MTLKLTLALLASLFILQPASAEIHVKPVELATEDVAAIRNIIIGQINAFQKDDAQKAFSYASPRIKERFQTPETFLHMVRKSYQSVYRPQTYKFLTIQNFDRKIVQPVTVIGRSGITETALYIMEVQPDGSWRIGACIIAPEPGHAT